MPNLNIDTKKIIDSPVYYQEVTTKLGNGFYDLESWSHEEAIAYAKADQKFRERNFEKIIDAKPKHPMPVSKPRRSEAELIFSRLLRNLGL